MDMVNQSDDCKFYIVKDLPEDTKRAGRATVQAFGVKSRFVHFEFFRLRQDQNGAYRFRFGLIRRWWQLDQGLV